MINIELFSQSYSDFDQEVINEIINMFFEDYPISLSLIENAIDAGDAVLLAQSAHKYKGTVGAMYDIELKELLQKLEQKGKDNDLEGVSNLFAAIQANSRVLAEDLKMLIK